MPVQNPPAGLLIAPGASADRNNRTMVALDEGLDLPVCRVTITARAQAKVLDGLRADLSAFCDELGVGPERIVLGGRSFGGRMCSMLVAEGQVAAGLVLLSYPLHPPDKPDVLRTAHFPALSVPCLFVSGTKDPFATPAELAVHTAAVGGPVETVLLDGEGHSPRSDAPVIAAVIEWLARLRR